MYLQKKFDSNPDYKDSSAKPKECDKLFVEWDRNI